MLLSDQLIFTPLDSRVVNAWFVRSGTISYPYTIYPLPWLSNRKISLATPFSQAVFEREFFRDHNDQGITDLTKTEARAVP
jgi:hypothetical protein